MHKKHLTICHLSLSHTQIVLTCTLRFSYILFFRLSTIYFSLASLSLLFHSSCDRLLKSSNHHHRATYTYSFRFIYFRQSLSRLQQQFYVSLSKKRIEPNQDERESIFCDCFSFDSIKYHSTHSV